LAGYFPKGWTYLQSLQYPEEVTGVKVPDLVAFPSSTFQLQYDGVIQAGAGGDSVAIIAYPRLSNTAGSASFPLYTLNGTVAGSINNIANVNWNNFVSVMALYSYWRPVSAVLTVEFIGPTSSDGGYMVGSIQPRKTIVPATVQGMIQLPGSKSTPVRNGMRVTWKPQDNFDLEYCQAGASYELPGIFFAATGLPSNIAYLKFNFTANFEALTGSDNNNLVDTEPSPINLGQLASAFQWAGQVANNVYPLFNKVNPYVAPVLGAVARKGLEYAMGGSGPPGGYRRRMAQLDWMGADY